MARGKSPASAPTGVDTQHICWLLSSGRDGICEMQQRLTGCGTLSCRSCGIGREMTHCGASIREQEEEKFTCVCFKVLRENNGSGLDIGLGEGGTVTWCGKEDVNRECTVTGHGKTPVNIQQLIHGSNTLFHTRSGWTQVECGTTWYCVVWSDWHTAAVQPHGPVDSPRVEYPSYLEYC